MGKTHGILFTISTYGTWLRGDVRGWIDEGKLMPPDPFLELQDEQRLKFPPFRFKRQQRFGVGEAIGKSLIERLDAIIWALCVQSWHVHFLTAPLRYHVSEVVKCAKDAARWHLRIDRPIWCTGYDKRFCFDWNAVWTRREYFEDHNLQDGLVARPWEFICEPPIADPRPIWKRRRRAPGV